MELRFACADFAFPLLEHEKSLRLIRMLEIDAVDIGLFQDRSHVQPSDVLTNIGPESAVIRSTLQANDLEAADLFLQLATDFHSKAINNPDPGVRTEAREAFDRTLEVANRIGSGHVSILPGAVFDSDKPGDSERRAFDELAWRVERSTSEGIVLGVEAHLGSLCQSPTAAQDLIDHVPGLTLTLDYTHFTKLGIPDAEIEPLIGVASHFHARGACRERAQTRLTDNTIDYPSVVAAMIQSDYRGYVGLEYVWIEWEHMNETDNVSETLLLKRLIQDAYDRATKGAQE